MKALLAAFILLIAGVALATTTQTSADGGKDVILTFTTGTELDPTTDGTQGLRLDGVAGFSIMVSSTGNMTSGGVFKAFLWNNNTLKWVRVWDGTLDLITAPTDKQAWAGLTVSAGQGRIMYVPYGVGVASSLRLVAVPKS